MIRFPKEDLIGLSVMHDSKVFGKIATVENRHGEIYVFVKWQPAGVLPSLRSETWVPIEEVRRVTLDYIEWIGK